MRPAGGERRGTLLAATGALVAAIVALQLGFDEPGLLYLAPALALLLPLAFGRYPGARLLHRVAGRNRRRRKRAAVGTPRRRSALALLPRGGALLASAFAGRPPPSRQLAPQWRHATDSRVDERKKMIRRIAVPIAAACALLAPAAAQAHVSLHPNEVPVGSFATLGIRVPNETEDANTIKVAVRFPPDFIDVSPEYMPGWSVEVKTEKLAKPVQTDDGEVTEGVKEIVWTGDGKRGKIPPEQFLDFPISTEIPGKEGEELAFKTLQYYDNGEVVRWIGPPNSEEPAPQIDVTAEGGVLQDVAGSETAPPSPAAGGAAGEAAGGGAEAAEANGGSGGGGASKGLAIAALLVGALGLLTGGAALVLSRRASRGGTTA